MKGLTYLLVIYENVRRCHWWTEIRLTRIIGHNRGSVLRRHILMLAIMISIQDAGRLFIHRHAL